MSGYVLQADISHWNSGFTAAKYKDDRIGLKSTDGAGNVDPTYATRVADAHDHGIGVEHYAFCESGDARAEAEFFVRTVKPHWQRGDRFALDAEVSGVDGAFVARFAAEMRRLEPTWQGMLYGTADFFEAHNIKLPAGWLVWIAHVTTNPEPNMPAGWPAWALWQFTFSAHVAGIDGSCDLSRVAPVKPNPKPSKKRAFGPVMRTAVKYATKHYNRRVKDGFVLDSIDAALTDDLVKAAKANRATK